MNRRGFFGSGAALLSASTPSLLLARDKASAGSDAFPHFDSIEAMKQETNLREGDLCSCPKGRYEIVSSNSYPANDVTVVDLAGGAGQAVLRAGETLTDMKDLLEDTRPRSWFPEATLVRTGKENFAFEVAEAKTSKHVTNANGAGFQLVNRPLVEFAAFGGGPDKSGAENAKALSSALRALQSEGGRILFGSGDHVFDPATYPTTNANVWLLGGGMRTTQFVPSSHDGQSREWMMTFGEDNKTTYLGFSGINVVPPADGNRAKFNGIRICSTNQLIIRDCYARFVDGTAWQIERAHNSKIDIRTYKCGSSDDGLNSVLISGSLGDFAGQEDAVFNDTIIVGMTEQDHLGWKIENGLVIRPESSIKVHGGPEATRSLHLHRISNGAMSIYPTLGFNSDAFVMISDAASAERQAVAIQTAPKPTRFNLNIISNHNIRYFGHETGSLIAIDCSAPGSRVILSGDLLKNIQRDGDYRYIHLMAPGDTLAEIDLSALKFQDEDSSKWILDERTGSAKTLSRRATGVYFPAVNGFVGSDAAKKLIGQTDHIVTDGDPTGDLAPGMSLIGLTETNDPNGTLLYSAMQPLTASIDSATEARTLIASQRLNIPLHGGDAATAVLRRLTLGATGISEARDSSNYWKVQLYVAGTSTDLVLCRDQTSTTAGDGLPSKVLEGWSAESHGFDFHQGIAGFAVTRNETFSVRLDPVGQPPALADITVTAYFEMRN